MKGITKIGILSLIFAAIVIAGMQIMGASAGDPRESLITDAQLESNTTTHYDTDGYFTLNFTFNNATTEVLAQNFTVWISNSTDGVYTQNGTNSSAVIGSSDGIEHGFDLYLTNGNWTFLIEPFNITGSSGQNASYNSTVNWLVVDKSTVTAINIQGNFSQNYDEGKFYINFTAPSGGLAPKTNYTLWVSDNESLRDWSTAGGLGVNYTQNITNSSGMYEGGDTSFRLNTSLILEGNYTFRVTWGNAEVTPGASTINNASWQGNHAWIVIDKTAPTIVLGDATLVNFTIQDANSTGDALTNYTGNYITIGYNISHKFASVMGCGAVIYINHTNTTDGSFERDAYYAGSSWENIAFVNGSTPTMYSYIATNSTGTSSSSLGFLEICNVTIYGSNFTTMGAFEIQVKTDSPTVGWSSVQGKNETGVISSLYADRYNAIGIINTSCNITGTSALDTPEGSHLNLSNIADYTSNITIVSYYNNTEKAWFTYTKYSAGTNFNITLDTNDAVYAYATKQNYMIRYLNRSIYVEDTSGTRANVTIYANVTNQTGAPRGVSWTNSSWNLIGNLFPKVMGNIINNTGNVSILSWYNNTNGMLYDYIKTTSNWDLNNDTIVQVGDAIWMLSNATGFGVSGVGQAASGDIYTMWCGAGRMNNA